MKTGILLINLGTPNSPHKKDVRAYLKEFLSDPRVIDIPALPRWLLVNLFILPFRPKKSAEAYEKIWTDAGSPLLIYTEKLATLLQHKIGNAAQVEFGMRYGLASIKSAIAKLSGCEKIIVLPLFPQYSSAATGSAIEKVLQLYAAQTNIPMLHIINNFYDQPWFIDPYAKIIENSLKDFNADFILFSYHGLPERQIDKSGCELIVCDRQQRCAPINTATQFCYRAQCFATTAALTKKLNLNSILFDSSFQSRLGRTPWIKPYTDEILVALFNKGIKRLAVVCPSFTADCLETLEEITIRAKDQWHALGGEAFLPVPCLNVSELWIDLLAKHLLTIC